MGFGKIWAVALYLVLAGCSSDESSNEGNDEDLIQVYTDSVARTCGVMRECYPQAQANAAPSSCEAPLSDGSAVTLYDATRAAKLEQCLRSHPDQAALNAWLQCVKNFQWSLVNCYEECPATVDACQARHQPMFASCDDKVDLTQVQACLNADAI